MSEVPVAWAMSAISPRMRSTLSRSAAAKAAHFLSMPRALSSQLVVELVAHVAFEEGAARHPVALGEAQHLAAKRGQAAVVGVQLLDQIFDLAGVELDALDLGGELLAQLVVLLLVGGREVAHLREGFEPVRLDLGEFLEQRGDGRELLERLGLEGLFHLGEREGVVLFLFLDRALGAPLDHVLFFVLGLGLGLVGDLFLFLDRGAGDLLADLAFAAGFAAFLGLGQLLGGRAFADSIASRSRISRSCIVPSLRFFDHPMMALKVIGLSHSPQIMMSRPASMRLAMAISPSRLSNSTAPISRRYMRTGSSVRSTASFLTAAAGRGPPSSSGSTSSSTMFSALLLLVVVLLLGALDDVDAHLGDRRHDVLDLLGRHLVLGQGLVQFVVSDEAALLGAGDQFLDRRVVEVDQRGIARIGRVDFLCFVLRHYSSRLVGAGE